MFLPKIVASIPTLLDDLLLVLKRCLCWKLLNKEKFIPPNSVGTMPFLYTKSNIHSGDVNKIVEYLKQLQDLKYDFHDIRVRSKYMRKTLYIVGIETSYCMVRTTTNSTCYYEM